jgi:rubrerythrin
MRKSYVLFVLAIMISLTSCQNNSEISNPETEEDQTSDQTTKDLRYALAGECQANRKYIAFAEIADSQGYPGIARLWRAAAAAEAIHARNHMKALGMLKSTEENLTGAVEGEQGEFSTMYPTFIATAEKAGRSDAAQSFDRAFKVEQIHYKLFLADLNELKKGEQPPAINYWVCSICGNTVPETPPNVCDICGSPKNKFFEVK